MAELQSDSIIQVTDSGQASVVQVTAPAFRFSDTDTSGLSIPVVPTDPDTFRLFSGHELRPVYGVPVTMNRKTDDWLTVILFLVVLGMTAIRAFYFRIFRQLVSAFFNNNVSNQIVRDENILVQRAASLMSVLFYFILTLFLYQYTEFYHWDLPFLGKGFQKFFLLLLVIAFAYSIKLLTLKAAGEMFNADRAVATYIFNIFLINNMLGLVLLPIVIAIAYVVAPSESGNLLTIGVVLAVLFFVYRLIRGFLVWRSIPGGSVFYFILYLCTLEFAPLLILYRIAIG